MRFPLHPLCLICWWILLSGATQQSCRIASNYSNSILKIQLTIQLPSANDDRKVVLPKKWRNCVAIGTAEPFQLLTTSNTNDANFSIHSLHYPWFDFNSFNLIRFIQPVGLSVLINDTGTIWIEVLLINIIWRNLITIYAWLKLHSSIWHNRRHVTSTDQINLNLRKIPQISAFEM